MARPATNHESRKVAIVEAALDCFATHGYDGTTNKIIAEAAGMKSPGIIYHYFGSKEDLFQACLERVSVFDTMRDLMVANQDEPPEVFLRQAAHTYLRLMRDDERLVKLAMIGFSSFQSHPEVPPLALRRVVPSLLLPLAAYFQRQAEAGVLRPLSPLSAVMQFFSPLVFRAITNRLAPGVWPIPVESDDAYVDGLVQTFLEGARRHDTLPPAGSHSH